MYNNSYTLKTIDGLISTTYISAIVFALVFVGISMLVANLIQYEGGKNPKDAKKRKIWFWLLAVISSSVFFIWNFLYVADKVKGKPAQSEFMINYSIATGVCLVVFVVTGIILSKLMKRSKYGTIFS